MTMHIFSLKFFCRLLSPLLLFIAFSQSSFASSIEERQFESEQLNQRYQKLIKELRCLVCQNQNLADSDASLAKDLRSKTAEMLKANKSDQEILDYMSERYGEFVLYRPPVNKSTSLLWFGPFVLLILVLFFLIRNTVKRNRQQTVSDLDADKLKQARDLLNDSKD